MFTEKKTKTYHGQFRVPDLEFKTLWGDNTSPEYTKLAGIVEEKVG